jgi:hypothetical protein
MLRLAVDDIHKGTFKYVMELRPAYADQGCEPVIVEGPEGQHPDLDEMYAEAKRLFMDRYNDTRPHAMMRPELSLRFDSGYSYSYEHDEGEEEYGLRWRIKNR